MHHVWGIQVILVTRFDLHERCDDLSEECVLCIYKVKISQLIHANRVNIPGWPDRRSQGLTASSFDSSMLQGPCQGSYENIILIFICKLRT